MHEHRPEPDQPPLATPVDEEHQANFAFGPPPNTVEVSHKENNQGVRKTLQWIAFVAVLLAVLPFLIAIVVAGVFARYDYRMKRSQGRWF